MLQLSCQGPVEAGAEVTMNREQEGAQWVRPHDIQVLPNDDFINQVANGDHRVEFMLRHISNDLYICIRRVATPPK